MNEHPEPLLVDYVDDALAPEDRARVEAHIRDCPSCREEVELAAAARQALGELPEVPAPPGLTFEIRRRARRAGGGLAWKVATGAAAAAVAIAGVVIALRPSVDGGAGSADSGPTSQARPGAARDAEAHGGPQQDAAASEGGRTDNSVLQAPLEARYVTTDRDYDPGSIVRFGQRLVDQARASVQSGFRQPATDFYATFNLDAYPRAARVAVECLLREAPPDELVVPYRVEAASFEGQRAYVGAFLQGPDEGAPYDRILLWVVDREACTLRYFASFKLP